MSYKSSTDRPGTRLAAIPAAVLCVVFMQCAHAQALADQSLEERLNTLMKVVNEQQRKIDALERQVVDLEMARRGRGEPGGPGDAAPATLMSQYTPVSPAPGEGTGTATGVPVNPPPPAGPGTAEPGAPGAIGTTQKAAEPTRTAAEEAVAQREHAPLFEHKLTIDWGISDTYYDRRQLQLSGFLALDAIFLGNLNLGQTKSHQLMSDVDVRYGLTERISVDADVPYMYRTSTFMNGGAGGAANTLSDTSVNSHALGDVNFGLYYQFVKEHGSVPDIVGSLRVKAPTGTSPFGIKLLQADPNNTNLVAPSKLPTGTGFWSITAGVSVLKTYDPVVLFGSVSYTYNVARSFSDISSVVGQTQPAKVKLGDIVQFGGGVALAFSERDSASIAYTMAIEPSTRTQAPGGSWQRVPGSQTTASTLGFGLNHVFNKHLTMNASVAIGLTPDAPNFVVGLRFPYTF
ncbi:hypothetical protein WL40_06600 [Burkholderia ubonensis]|uniref:Transporter n=2 Tax=Burkholderia cepacia complex TaxID=87882 RepID=A0AAW3MHN3_9BURK|nr:MULTISPECIES: hypothetical protein [Burkholderia cepacia complex]AOK14615.1 hypothetical protein WT26_00675 [Burkholderia cepacia]AOK21331.1 hypothetical protein WK67_00675 [Burkholderia ubonensis]KVL24965.1 hypothetical protein WJ45_01065 [Burkholderia ubonensis]KVN73768.1 hypothetical protein WJ67_19725 [Burkholderia ubonensis]KVO46032.1 hypothetical protein WJ76_29780 [Burkholderia ubonensis]